MSVAAVVCVFCTAISIVIENFQSSSTLSEIFHFCDAHRKISRYLLKAVYLITYLIFTVQFIFY